MSGFMCSPARGPPYPLAADVDRTTPSVREPESKATFGPFVKSWRHHSATNWGPTSENRPGSRPIQAIANITCLGDAGARPWAP